MRTTYESISEHARILQLRALSTRTFYGHLTWITLTVFFTSLFSSLSFGIYSYMCGIYVNMTLEDLVGCKLTEKKMENVSQALEELLVAAQRQDCLTVGVYESAKLMNVDPDSVVLCVLAADEEDEDDIALQIHFTLIQAFCCDIDINILRVSGMRRLAQVLGEQDTVDSNGNEPKDLHCILVTSPHVDDFKSQALKEVGRFCKENRCKNQWIPSLALQER